MTKAERTAIKMRIRDLMNAGLDKEMATTIAKVEFEYMLIAPVVNDGQEE